MLRPYTFFIGLRYAGAKRRSQLVSFISLIAMLGMTIGVALLIVVLSVMNGFDLEMRQRILALVPHVTVKSYSSDIQHMSANWEQVEAIIHQHPEVQATAPFVRVGGMLLRGTDVESVLIYGIDINREKRVSIIDEFLDKSAIEQLASASDVIVMGAALANKLELAVGDSVNVMVPRLGVTGRSQPPSFKKLMMAGQFNTGTELDQSIALVRLASAEQLAAGDNQAHGIRILLDNTFSAPRVAWELEQNLPYGFVTQDWTRHHGNLYSAIQLSKQLVGLMLLTIIAVAAFNVVSALVMVVTDKQGDIAILRTLGASSRDIMTIFMVQGSLVGIVGTFFGVLFGVLLSLSITDLVTMLEGLFNHQFLQSDVYPIDYLPADLRLEDVMTVALTALFMSFLATIYPARKAAKVMPADALRYEL